MSTIDSVLERVRRVDPIGEVDLRQWASTAEARRLFDLVVGSSVVERPRRHRARWLTGGAVVVSWGIGDRCRRVRCSRRTSPRPDPRPPRRTRRRHAPGSSTQPRRRTRDGSREHRERRALRGRPERRWLLHRDRHGGRHAARRGVRNGSPARRSRDRGDGADTVRPSSRAARRRADQRRAGGASRRPLLGRNE